ncbi:hypothetical protein QAD02_007254 [Eretmocerus hayati]|uniref:Uncharacterized protein n=1 Tax=Eretmocerus hayati TaxID=131215 RepID=A0ACC2N5K3_9HYME|nr:hypothetical protein QAD02_007254 [Eretmocerus hayati]
MEKKRKRKRYRMDPTAPLTQHGRKQYLKKFGPIQAMQYVTMTNTEVESSDSDVDNVVRGSNMQTITERVPNVYNIYRNRTPDSEPIPPFLESDNSEEGESVLKCDVESNDLNDEPSISLCVSEAKGQLQSSDDEPSDSCAGDDKFSVHYVDVDGLSSTDDEVENPKTRAHSQSDLCSSDEDSPNSFDWHEDCLYSSSDEETENYRKSSACAKDDTLEKKTQIDSLLRTVQTTNTVCPGAFLRSILHRSFRNHICFSGIVDMANLFNIAFNQKLLPDTRYLVDKMCNANTEFTLHAACLICSADVGTFVEGQARVKCHKCHSLVDVSRRCNPNFFAIIDPSEVVRDLLQTYGDHYDNVLKGRKPSATVLRDVYDSSGYRSFRASLPESEKYLYVSGSFQADGMEAFEDSLYSIWPIYIIINELPPPPPLKLDLIM